MTETWISTTDYHTAGEPFRIVTEGAPVPSGATVGARRVNAMADESGIDGLRRLLCNEPRGHADMYGGFITPPDDEGAHFGVLFWHKDGFSTACGHGTIALGVWATDTGLVESDPDGVTEVRIDVPSGRVAALVERSGGALVRATFRNVASHAIARGVEVETSRGTVRADLSFSGAIYASVRAADLGLSVTPDHYTELIALGREVKWALNESPEAQHAADPRLSGVYGTILWDDLGRHDGGPRQRNVTVFADGEVDRSPCGSGTGARVALLADDGTLGSDETLKHRSIVDTVFAASWNAGPVAAEGRPTVIPSVSGTAYRTGEHRFMLDPADALGDGFVLR
ncbi:proline racemase [Leucobacter sp. OLJS4]|uniref:proline racemase family protein n=1 Tax=unclassified Leucobacter TaxID=2621730 RepID=UPI000C195B16|nr:MULTISPECIES: proline racemase family protein [unclassified Leucobacter]PIJ48875.1 proline racemase [Leucobacter sp. OLES1]PII82217.1 proline racemase [Leucobacter sp. OLCALW19]PII88503.1 proline racemase [Leucobacter sp. OLTLW20]PII94191.1 proline racemase [Leucobacter sp. OLAS13]PII98237.1 proline racemase [Leucobacter sp. OLDS2]